MNDAMVKLIVDAWVTLCSVSTFMYVHVPSYMKRSIATDAYVHA